VVSLDRLCMQLRKARVVPEDLVCGWASRLSIYCNLASGAGAAASQTAPAGAGAG